MSAYVVLAYGILVGLGGIMGFVKSKSKASLISGSISGVLLIVSSIFMMNGNAMATYFALVLSVVLLTIFFQRYRVSKKVMPAGVMVVMSLVMTLILLLKVS